MGFVSLQLWSEDECAAALDAVFEILETVGVEVRYAPALDVCAAAGAEVDGSRVRMPRECVRRALESAPKTWQVLGRGAGAGMELSADAGPYYGTGSDLVFVLDPQTSDRRRAVLSDVEGNARLIDQLPNLDFVMSMGLPSDVPVEVDDVAQCGAMLRGTQKPLMLAPKDGTSVRVMAEMVEACGDRRSLLVYAMPSPPLTHDAHGLTKVMVCAELDLPVIYAPAPSGGATSPLSIAGGAVVGIAEVLSGLVVHQQVKRGAPFVFGCGYSVLDFRTGNNCYVTPESFLGLQACCDMARHLDLPSFSYAGVSDSKALDMQLASDAALTAVLGGLSRATLLHDAGYLETGLCSSEESIVLSDDLIGFVKAYMKEVATHELDQTLEEVREVGPGGSFLARPYTRRRCRDMWRSDLFDHLNHQRWVDAGALTLERRLKQRCGTIRATTHAFELPASVRGELDRLVSDSLADRLADAAAE